MRTNRDAKKQLGISFLLIDMATPGVSTRPIVLISGKSPFCETFFDNVVVPKSNLVGKLDRGWDVAKYLLTHEREMIAGGGSNLFDTHALDKAAAKAAPAGCSKTRSCAPKSPRPPSTPTPSDATRRRYVDEIAAGGELGARSAQLKYDGTELNKRRHELAMALAGARGALFRRQSRPRRRRGLAALEGQFHRGRHVGSDARHRLQAPARPARGLTPC